MFRVTTFSAAGQSLLGIVALNKLWDVGLDFAIIPRLSNVNVGRNPRNLCECKEGVAGARCLCAKAEKSRMMFKNIYKLSFFFTSNSLLIRASMPPVRIESYTGLVESDTHIRSMRNADSAGTGGAVFCPPLFIPLF